MGTTIAVITASDLDDGQSVRISVTGGNEESYFLLQSGTNYGVLRQNRLLDKPMEQFLLKFCATDNGVPPRSSERMLQVDILQIT